MIDVFYSRRYSEYDFGPGHPFTPRRWEALYDLLQQVDGPFSWREPRMATDDEILNVHRLPFLEAVKTASAGYGTPTTMQFGLGTGDVPIFLGMHEATQRVCGGTIGGARLVARRPGVRVLQLGGGLHHAMPGRAAGFCVFNDVAMGILALLDEGLRVAFVDIDVHHSDGVQAVFYNEPNVLTISLHESGRFLFPGTGFVHESGGPDAPGTAINIPLHPGTGDRSYVECFDQVVPEAVRRFGPDVLVVEVGADAHFRDPLAGISLTTWAYGLLIDRLIAIAEDSCSGRFLATLGGGYGFDATVRIWAMLALKLAGQALPDRLPVSWSESWSSRTGLDILPALMDPPDAVPPSEYTARAAEINRQTLEDLRGQEELRGLVGRTRS
jgi:acetoin utilization protein AcuC